MIKADFTPLEFHVLNMLLAGDDAVLAALREQLASVTAVSRNLTGHGFYLHFVIPPTTLKLHEILPVKQNFCFGDVVASGESFNSGAGFLLWIQDGVLCTLEGYTYDEPWPISVNSFEVKYISGEERDYGRLQLQWLKSAKE